MLQSRAHPNLTTSSNTRNDVSMLGVLVINSTRKDNRSSGNNDIIIVNNIYGEIVKSPTFFKVCKSGTGLNSIFT